LANFFAAFCDILICADISVIAKIDLPFFAFVHQRVNKIESLLFPCPQISLWDLLEDGLKLKSKAYQLNDCRRPTPTSDEVSQEVIEAEMATRC
jgi:hypothetical protein